MGLVDVISPKQLSSNITKGGREEMNYSVTPNFGEGGVKIAWSSVNALKLESLDLFKLYIPTMILTRVNLHT